MIDTEAIHLALRAKLLTVAELPTLRAWESVRFTPDIGEASVEDALGPHTTRLRSATAANGILEATGIYVVKIYGIANQGDAAIREIVTALLGAYPPGASMTLDSGDALRIPGDVGPAAGQVLPIGKNKVQCTITIPWLVWSQNPATLSLAS